MTYRGFIKNGVAVLDLEANLPEGTPVRVEVDGTDLDFWKGKTLDELAQEQGVESICNLEELAIDWPEEDSLDELQALIREVRR